MQVAIPLFDRVHRARRRRALRSAATHSVDRRGVRRTPARRGAHRKRHARRHLRRHLRRGRRTGCGGDARRYRNPSADPRRSDPRLAAIGTPAHHVHHLGVHRRAVARRRGSARWTHRDDSLERRRTAQRIGRAYVPDRVVEHLPQRIITAAGVSSGIDMALRLVELLVDREAAQAAQLLIEYDPQPPFDSGSLAKADAATRARADEFRQARK